MKKSKISKYILFVASLTLITALIVVIQNSYNRLVSARSIVDQQLITSFEAKIDFDVLDLIDSKIEAPADFTPSFTPLAPFDIAPSPFP